MEFQKRKNPFFMSPVNQHMKMLSSEKDLFALRQLSTQHFNTFSAAYFDKLDKYIAISQRDGRFPRGPWASGSLEGAMDFAYIYRKLILTDLSFLDADTGKNGQEVIQFIRKVGPYINNAVVYLDFPNEHLDVLYNIHNMAYVSNPVFKELLKSMTNLESVVLVDGTNQLRASFRISETLAVLPHYTRIRYEALKPMPGPILQILAAEIINAKQTYDQFNAEIVLQGINIYSEEELHYFANDWLENNKESEIPFVQLLFSDDTFANEENVKNYLNKFLISCKCQYLVLEQSNMTIKWDLAAYGIWRKNITGLFLKSYSHPLLHFEEFPKLSQLDLIEVDVNACLFSDQNKSHEENLRDVLNGFMNKDKMQMECSYFPGSPMMYAGYQFIGPGTPLEAFISACIRHFLAFEREDQHVMMAIL